MKKSSQWLCAALGLNLCLAPMAMAAPAKPRKVPKPHPRPALPSRPLRSRSEVLRLLRHFESQRQNLLHKFTANSPEVRSVERAISQLRSELQSLPPAQVFPPATRPRFQLLDH
jgi:hypothetical protein